MLFSLILGDYKKMPESRRYLTTHPWLTFDARFDRVPPPPQFWMLLGEARSKCEHLAGVPLSNTVSLQLHQLYLAKGVQGTTAIEGNTLTVEQVEQHLRGELRLPPSQKYLQQEISNIMAACKAIGDDSFHNRNRAMTPELVTFFNQTVLAGLEVGEGVEPGKLRKGPFGVLRYIGAPAEDCEYLLEKLCAWLNSTAFGSHEEFGLAIPILKAVIAHLYIAWIHPFGDGNGRTARLIEFYTLVHAGVPSPAAHLLSNHYNLTRTAYYRELDKASRSGGDIVPFILYALQGFVDQLRDQISLVQAHQVGMAWRDLVNEFFEDRTSPAEIRRKKLVIWLSWLPGPMKRREMLKASEISEAYQGKTIKTLTRDLNLLVRDKLVERTRTGFRARSELILGFLPLRHEQAQEQIRDLARAQQELPFPTSDSAS